MGVDVPLRLRPILRTDIDKLGYRKTFSIYDDTDAKRLMTLVARDQNLDLKKFPPAACSTG